MLKHTFLFQSSAIDESDERSCVGCHLVATPLLSCYTGIDIMHRYVNKPRR